MFIIQSSILTETFSDSPELREPALYFSFKKMALAIAHYFSTTKMKQRCNSKITEHTKYCSDNFV